jgi:hypothetical protein
MINKIILTILGALIGLTLYFGVWAVKYRLPPAPAALIDLRKSPVEEPYCVSFCASLADNPLGFPGHTYIVWSPSLAINLEKDHSLGFMPKHEKDQIRSLFAPVEGTVLDHVSGNLRNLDRLTVIVSKDDYLKSLLIASTWTQDGFCVGKRDCAAFVHHVASALHLRTQNPSYLFPQEYLCQLKRLNQPQVTQSCFWQGRTNYLQKASVLPALNSSFSLRSHQVKLTYTD